MKDYEERNDFPRTIDLNEWAKRHDVRIIVEPAPFPAVIAESKIKQDDAAHKRRKDWLLFRVGVCAGIVLTLLCIAIIVTTPEGTDRSWALTTLTAVVTGLFGYRLGAS